MNTTEIDVLPWKLIEGNIYYTKIVNEYGIGGFIHGDPKDLINFPDLTRLARVYEPIGFSSFMHNWPEQYERQIRLAAFFLKVFETLADIPLAITPIPLERFFESSIGLFVSGLYPVFINGKDGIRISGSVGPIPNGYAEIVFRNLYRIGMLAKPTSSKGKPNTEYVRLQAAAYVVMDRS
jgi:hypothetical protein